MFTQIALFILGFISFFVSISIWGREPGIWIGIIAFLILSTLGYLIRHFRSFRQIMIALPIILIPSYFLFFLTAEFISKRFPRGLGWFYLSAAVVTIYAYIAARMLRRFFVPPKSKNDSDSSQGQS